MQNDLNTASLMEIKPGPLKSRHASLAATVAVLELARSVEPSMLKAIYWYRKVPIAELGNLSARWLVMNGEAASVIAFLKSIQRGERG